MTPGEPAAGVTPEPVRARRALLAHVRHELGTPLNAIIGYSEMLLEETGSAEAASASADLQQVHDEGMRLLSLVNETLDPGKIDAGLLNTRLDQVGAALGDRARASLAAVVGAAQRLLGNPGFGAASPGRADVERIHAAALALRGLIDDLARVESPGAPEQTARPAPRSASGVIESMLGSEQARGGPVPSGERAALLVVDDNETNRDILSRLLERQGHRVTRAAGGHEALARLAQDRFDLVLLDILMPDMNGFEVLGRLKSAAGLREIPVILISALDDTFGKVQAFRAGGVDYVTKPFQAEEVAARVENQLKISRLQRDLARQNQELSRKNAELVEAHRRTDLVFSALAEALPGTVLDGKYRLEEKIGSGGFGAVFRGTHLGLDLPVAIKVFRPMGGNDSPEALERFRQEGIAASRIKHPNAVEIYDNGISATGIAYLVMELMKGQTLEEELRDKGALTPGRTIEILVPVCEALAEVHASGIVHRDITPANIYLHQGRKGEVVKLLDFGLSKIMGGAADQTLLNMTMSGAIAGTPAYMAPERLMSGTVDGRSDVYSLGVLLFRMLAGKSPFETESGAYAVALLHLTREPPSLRAERPDLPAEFDDLIQRALAKDPAERPAASELAERLKAIPAAPAPR